MIEELRRCKKLMYLFTYGFFPGITENALCSQVPKGYPTFIIYRYNGILGCSCDGSEFLFTCLKQYLSLLPFSNVPAYTNESF